MRRRKYLSVVASGTALTVAGCFGSEDDDGDDGGDDGNGGDNGDNESNGNESNGNESDGDGSTGSEELDEPLDVVVTNDHENGYTFEVVVTDEDGETVLDDTTTLETGSSDRFEDVVSETGTYTVEATKAESVSRTYDWEVTADSEDAHVYVAEDGEYTITEGEP